MYKKLISTIFLVSFVTICNGCISINFVSQTDQGSNIKIQFVTPTGIETKTAIIASETPITPEMTPTAIASITPIPPEKTTSGTASPQPTSTALPLYNFLGNNNYFGVSLLSIGNRPLDNLAYPISGEYTFVGIPFHILSGSTAIFQTQQHFSNLPDHANISTNLIHPDTVYLLVDGGYVYKTLEGKTVGEIILTFNNGNEFPTDLIAGVNFREDWGYTSGRANVLITDVITELTPFYFWQNVYQENQMRGGEVAHGYIDMLTIRIPKIYQSLTMTSIKIQDLLLGPSIKICAITVKIVQ